MMMHGLALPHACMPAAREAALTALAVTFQAWPRHGRLWQP